MKNASCGPLTSIKQPSSSEKTILPESLTTTPSPVTRILNTLPFSVAVLGGSVQLYGRVWEKATTSRTCSRVHPRSTVDGITGSLPG